MSLNFGGFICPATTHIHLGSASLSFVFVFVTPDLDWLCVRLHDWLHLDYNYMKYKATTRLHLGPVKRYWSHKLLSILNTSEGWILNTWQPQKFNTEYLILSLNWFPLWFRTRTVSSFYQQVFVLSLLFRSVFKKGTWGFNWWNLLMGSNVGANGLACYRYTNYVTI